MGKWKVRKQKERGSLLPLLTAIGLFTRSPALLIGKAYMLSWL